MRLSVPGNLLLLGEYAVLEEGGIGLAMAVERRVRITSHPWDDLLIQGSLPGASVSWTPGGPPQPLFSAATDAVHSWMSASGRGSHEWRTRITVDSTALFSPEGRKVGLGSSAAVTVGLVCALLEAASIPGPVRDAAAPGIALEAHRRLQGGVGSGYDLTCSLRGGIGIFRGTAVAVQSTAVAVQSWEAWRPAALPAVLLFPGRSPVATPDAVRRYFTWKGANPAAARDFLSESNRCVLAFLRAEGAAAALPAFTEYKRVSVALGEAIGVSAQIAVPDGLDPAWCKSLGAGNELGVCLVPPGTGASEIPEGVAPALLSPRGVTWGE
jgi:phosphomevalonate kinase